MSNKTEPNDYRLPCNKIQVQNNVSPSCDGIIMRVDASFQAKYSTFTVTYQMDNKRIICTDSSYGCRNTNIEGLLKSVCLIDEKF